MIGPALTVAGIAAVLACLVALAFRGVEVDPNTDERLGLGLRRRARR